MKARHRHMLPHQLAHCTVVDILESGVSLIRGGGAVVIPVLSVFALHLYLSVGVASRCLLELRSRTTGRRLTLDGGVVCELDHILLE